MRDILLHWKPAQARARAKMKTFAISFNPHHNPVTPFPLGESTSSASI